MSIEQPLRPGFFPELDRKKYLYHYTTMDTAINYVLRNRTLRFNSLANVNDPMEADPSRWAFSSSEGNRNDDVVHARLKDHFQNRSKVVCFSRDDQSEGGSQEFNPLDYCSRGHSKPRMWATYGDDHKGVCLIFDKKILGKAFERGLNGRGQLLQGAVRYGKRLPADENDAAVFDMAALRENFDGELKRKIDKHHRTYFFYKHVDWATEDEYRFLITGGHAGSLDLPFENALVGVAVGMKSSEKPDFQIAVGNLAQAIDVPCRYLSWGWKGGGYAPVNEAAMKRGLES